MAYYSRNKNELLALTGAVYSFVAYLTAFTIEVLFIIDLAKRSGNNLNGSVSLVTQPSPSLYDEDPSQQAGPLDQARPILESTQTHATISCLAISTLYFVIFVASLILIVALILRSTFFILIWMCVMITMYLPEFGLIVYVSIYGWGIDTRNGQTELLFYLFRATLNVIFIFRAHKLYKEWNYEKNFFRLKPGHRFTGYDSPYFIGDSLTTTINPMFSASTLNLNRYDHIRDSNKSPAQNSVFPDYDYFYEHNHDLNMQRRKSSPYPPDVPSGGPSERIGPTRSRSGLQLSTMGSHEYDQRGTARRMRQSSILSIKDQEDLEGYEMDLDYRTLNSQNHYDRGRQTPSSRGLFGRISEDLGTRQSAEAAENLTRTSAGLCYSTQSLDRRQLGELDFALPEHVILRPLGHQPFEYLQRPGSTSNLSSLNNLSTQPMSYLSNSCSRK